jgi:succinate dehydrogenase/fumarate reductase flavoprotein subunit
MAGVLFVIQHDVVVVGSGIAGMRCALEIKRRSASTDVVLVSKLYPVRSPSVIERTGIAAALGNVVEGANGTLQAARDSRPSADSIEAHIADTLAFGGEAGNRAAVAALCEAAPQAVIELELMGTPFSRTKEGRIAQTVGAGHSKPRLAYAADRTGHAILHTLYGELVRYGIKIYPECYMLGLLTDGGRAVGISTLDIRSGTVEAIGAKVTVFATGSYGRAFDVTADAQSSTGDGLAAAARAGVTLKDMGKVQFHPLGLGGTGFVINERLLSDGAYLLNAAEQRFMSSYSPALAERAHPAAVSEAIASEIAAGRGAGAAKSHVWLDVRHLPAQHIREHVPHLIEFARDYLGLNPFEELIPVQPTAQHALGGIPTDLDGRVEGLENFYAVGACATNGVHGNAALPGNMLAAAVVFGRRAGEAIASTLRDVSHGALPASAEQDAEAEVSQLLERKGSGRAALLREELISAAGHHNGAPTAAAAGQQHLGLVRELHGRFEQVELDDKNRRFNTDLVEALELSRLLEVSSLVAQASVADLAPAQA